MKQPEGGSPALNVMAIRDQRDANVSEQKTLSPDVDGAPPHGTAVITYLVNDLPWEMNCSKNASFI